jgi:hypothetical protein
MTESNGWTYVGDYDDLVAKGLAPARTVETKVIAAPVDVEVAPATVAETA